MAGTSNLGEVKRTSLTPPSTASQIAAWEKKPDWLLILLVGFGLYVLLGN